ncbi:MAG: class B sortase [Streptococcus gallolyticus]|nr:class B sortase [Streptococcus gallolyticus]
MTKNRSKIQDIFRIIICLGIMMIIALPKSVGAIDYENYKPGAMRDGLTGFDQLKVKNPEVLGWLSIYGTQIDYPYLQTDDNQKYLSMNPEGDYAITGSVFLDYRSQSNFDDFNTIIYGHHVPNGSIFGEIKKFSDSNFFESHRYGSIYIDGVEKGLEIFALLEVDAYDKAIYSPGVKGDTDRNSYSQYLLSKAVQKRSIDVSAQDKLVLMSTCFVGVTNGRHILAAKITDKVPEDTFGGVSSSGQSLLTNLLMSDHPVIVWLQSVSRWHLFLLVIFLLIVSVCLVIAIVMCCRRIRGLKRRRFSEI